MAGAQSRCHPMCKCGTSLSGKTPDRATPENGGSKAATRHAWHLAFWPYHNGAAWERRHPASWFFTLILFCVLFRAGRVFIGGPVDIWSAFVAMFRQSVRQSVLPCTHMS